MSYSLKMVNQTISHYPMGHLTHLVRPTDPQSKQAVGITSIVLLNLSVKMTRLHKDTSVSCSRIQKNLRLIMNIIMVF